MKVKPYEIVASALAAVAAAAVASVFGVKGTLVGAAIGSSVATTVAALVNQSAARAQRVMKRSGVTSITSLTRRPQTASVGDVDASNQVNLAAESRAGEAESSLAGDTQPVVTADTEPLVEEPTAGTPGPSGGPPHLRGDGDLSRRRWRLSVVLAASALAAFVLALGVLTLIEVGAGRSLSSIFGGPKSGSTVGGLFNGPSPATTTTPSTSATTTTSSSTTTSTSSTTTSTTAPGTASSTPPASTSTSTPGLTVP